MVCNDNWRWSRLRRDHDHVLERGRRRGGEGGEEEGRGEEGDGKRVERKGEKAGRQRWREREREKEGGAITSVSNIMHGYIFAKS